MSEQEIIKELKSTITKIKEEILKKEDLLDDLYEKLENMDINKNN